MHRLHTKHPYINIRMIVRVLGYLLFIEAGFMLIPLVTSLIYGEADALAFASGIGITAVLGLSMRLLPVKTKEMRKRDAIMLTALVWVAFSLFGMLPFLFSGCLGSITDAFFEAMSGFTTTGLSVFPTLDNLPHGILIWRCVSQWIGGLGIIIFTLAVLPMLNYSGGLQLFNAEVSGLTYYKLRPRVSSTAKGMWLVYIFLTFLSVILLLPSEMNLFESVCYSMSTMSTGGFAVSDAGIGAWNSHYIMGVLTVFMFLGGINFGLLFNAAHGNFKPLAVNDTFRWFIYIILAATAIMACCIAYTGRFDDAWDLTLLPLFQSVSVSSSTGIVTEGFRLWGPLATFVILFLMTVGACAGSTSGGAKIDRLIVVVKNVKNEFFRIIHPNAILSVHINKKGVPAWMLQKAMAFMLLYVIVIGVATVAMACMGLPLQESFFTVLEAITNTGLGVHTDGSVCSYGYLPSMAKYLLAFVMLAGRLELYTVLVLFSSAFWHK